MSELDQTRFKCLVCFDLGVAPITVYNDDGDPIEGADICPHCKGVVQVSEQLSFIKGPNDQSPV